MKGPNLIVPVALGVLTVLLFWCIIIFTTLNQDEEVPDYTQANRIMVKRLESERFRDKNLKVLDGLIVELNHYILSDFTRDKFYRREWR